MTRARRKYHNRLRKHRRIMGYSQKQVAWLLGHKNTSTISRWEKGVSIPTVENLLRLGYLYRTLCDELYFDQGLKFRHTLRNREQQVLNRHKEEHNGP